jgi:hypothetical protein
MDGCSIGIPAATANYPDRDLGITVLALVSLHFLLRQIRILWDTVNRYIFPLDIAAGFG